MVNCCGGGGPLLSTRERNLTSSSIMRFVRQQPDILLCENMSAKCIAAKTGLETWGANYDFIGHNIQSYQFRPQWSNSQNTPLRSVQGIQNVCPVAKSQALVRKYPEMLNRHSVLQEAANMKRRNGEHTMVMTMVVTLMMILVVGGGIDGGVSFIIRFMNNK